MVLLSSCLLLAGSVRAQSPGYSFSPSGLQGLTLTNPTSLQFGPDGRLYVSQQNGLIKAFTVVRHAANNYSVTATETITNINQIPNHNDDGQLAPEVATRQVTGLLVTGTAADPILYVSSSDSRVGTPGDVNLDTNSGTISRLTRSASSWSKVDLVRGLPRSEENHSVNGMQLDEASNTMFIAVGGNTNAGSPSARMAMASEYALSAAILSIDLTAIDQLPTKGSGNTAYKYDLPTMDDPTRPNNADGTDVADPFGGNDGLNQARIVPGGPVQVYSPGYRNPYDLVITRTPGKAGRMYTVDNGANQGWGGHPDQEGSTGLVTNNYVAGEPGSSSAGPNDPQVNNLDHLHFIGNIGSYTAGSYYGGHPNPIRANPQGAGLYTYEGSTGVWRTGKTGTHPLPADWPPVPLSAANPVEGDYRLPGSGNGALLTFYSSTNGLTEYTASNFNDALKGTLLAAGFNGDIYKIIPTADGTGVSNKIATWSPNRVNDEPSFASGFGARPLDLTAQGDEDIFPGTIWAASYGSHAITIFEPQDFVNCGSTYSLTLDDDRDGFSNADETDNQTDPCSASSKPQDFDGDLLSDLNDPDDDNDGLADKADSFALDGANGLATGLPVSYELSSNDPGTGLFGLGFTGLMSNGIDDYQGLYDKSNLTAGGGALSVAEVPAGDALGSLNNQQNAFQFGVHADASQGPFTVQGRMAGPFFNNAVPQNFQSQGIYIGKGDQDNYLKIALNANNGQGGIEVVYEADGLASSYQYPLVGGLPGKALDLYLSVDPLAGTVQPRYARDDGAITSLGAPIAVGGALLTAIQGTPALAVGLIATSRGSTVFTAAWDFIRVTADPVTATGLTASPANLHFFSQQAGTTSAAQRITVVNGTTTERIISSVTISGANSGEFSHTATGSLALAPGDSTGIDVTFTPDSLGTKVAQLQIAGADGTSVLSVGLTGEGHDNPPAAAHRLNAAGPELSTSLGNFAADTYFAPAPGYTYRVANPIAGTLHDALYQTERASAEDNGSFSYALPVDNGQYRVVLHFAEVYWKNVNQRVFDVQAEGALVLDNYDIMKKAGANFTATSESFTVRVTDGMLELLFSALASEGGVNRPKVSAIEVIPADGANQLPVAEAGADQTIALPTGSVVLQGAGSDADGTIQSYAWQQVSGPNTASFSSAAVAKPTVSGLEAGSYVFSLSVKDDQQGFSMADQVTVTVNPDPNAPVLAAHRINAGGQQVSNALGTFAADSYFTGAANVNTVSNPIAGTANDAIYQSERFSATDNGSFSYALPVGKGSYKVVLHFAELYHNWYGKRVFDVKAEGVLVLDNYDIYRQTGGRFTATSESFTVRVADGTLDLLFSALASEGGADRPKVSAIEVIPADGANQLPVADAGADQTIALPTGSVVLQGAGSDADGTVQSYVWQQVSGPNTASFSSATVANPTVSGLKAGSYVFSLSVKDDQQGFSVADLVTVTVNGAQAAAYRINAGGSQVSNALGTFAADSHFTGAANVNTVSNPIDATTDDAIYQSERFSATDNGSFGYALPVDNGQYTVVLHFAELYHNWYGKRVFDVKAEGALVLDNYDIFGKAGDKNTATTETFVVNVADGTLDLLFSALASEGGADRPKVSAIEVIPADGANQLPVADAGADQTIFLSAGSVVLQGAGSDADGTVSGYFWQQVSGPNTASFSSATVAAPTVSGLEAGSYVFSLTVKDDQQGFSVADQVTVTVNPDPNVQVLAAHRINAGGGQVNNALGTFAADSHFTGAANVNTVSNPIAGTANDAMYQSERISAGDNGSFGYALPVDNGQYTVVLHFAELYHNWYGKRVFDVQAEGALVLDNYDIYRQTGGRFTATSESFTVNVADGSLELLFSALASEGGADRPKVSAIEVIPFQAGAQTRLAVTAASAEKPQAGQALSLTAYPNPFQQQINLKMAGAPAGQYTIRVLDVLGRQLYRSGFTAGAAGGQVHTISLADKSLTNGSLYLVVVEQVNGSLRKVIKVMKE